MGKYIFILLAFTFIFSCKKQEANKPVPINFHGIISTDANGNIIYNNDSTDWKQNDIWSATEAGLFTSSKPICINPFNYRIIGFPNPCNGYMYINYHQSHPVRFEYRVVDRYYNILLANDSLNMSKDSFNSVNYVIDLSKYKGGDTIRMYYKIITSNCECRGHGDIVVK